jgi:hypothetical protein
LIQSSPVVPSEVTLKVDDAVFLAPRTLGFRTDSFVAKKTERHVVATELVNDLVELASREASGCEFIVHCCISLIGSKKIKFISKYLFLLYYLFQYLSML